MAKAMFDGTQPHAANLADAIEISSGGIVSKPIIDTGALKLILFAMDADQQVSEHRSPFPATAQVIDGEMDVTVDGKTHNMKANDWLYMPPNAAHDLVAKQPAKFLLTLFKGAGA